MFEIIFAAIISFCVTFALIPWLGKKLKYSGINGRDMHKLSRPKLPEMGGISVVIGFFSGFIVINFLYRDIITNELSAALIAILGAAFVGMLDDLLNLRQRIKAVLPFLFGLPLALAITDTAINIPLIGTIEIGFLMLLLVPFAITSAANVTNMLEGFNGLSTGLGIIICVILGIIAYFEGATITLYLILPLAGAAVAFLYYNSYPASIFPGDTLTLFMGATIATAAILGKLEFLGALLFTPMILEFVLKARGKYKNRTWADSFGKPDRHGVLHYRGPIESLTHWFMKNGKYHEWELVRTLWLIEIVLGVFVIFIYSLS
jgi:UDP-N-acetylglucosamine--dolichyl-phosphate N-acetylglucosaminephosphotransferase